MTGEIIAISELISLIWRILRLRGRRLVTGKTPQSPPLFLGGLEYREVLSVNEGGVPRFPPVSSPRFPPYFTMAGL